MPSYIISITSPAVGTNNASVVAIGTPAELKLKLKDQTFLKDVSRGTKPILALVTDKAQFAVIPQTSYVAAPLAEESLPEEGLTPSAPKDVAPSSTSKPAPQELIPAGK